MKNVYLLLSLVLFTSFLLISCATGSGTATVLDKSFNPENSKISLLPPRFKFDATGTIDIGSEQSIGRMVYNTLVQRTSSDWLSPEESVSLIQDANVLDEYEALLDGYQKTGIPSKSKLMILSETVKCPYIALCQIEYKITGITGMSNYRIAGLTIQVLSANDGKVVLELVGSAQCGSGGYDIGAVEIMQKAIDEAISYFPGAKPVQK
jgi:hypothetical protein